uniref:Uncharacterized protein n=1 Tax=Meloidogyne incognita TaxID=6306 RepID=A0A914KLC9_MELIC
MLGAKNRNFWCRRRQKFFFANSRLPIPTPEVISRPDSRFPIPGFFLLPSITSIVIETVFIDILRFIDIYRYIFSVFVSEYCLYEISITNFYIKKNNRD